MWCRFHFAKQELYDPHVIFICGWKSCWAREAGLRKWLMFCNIHAASQPAHEPTALSLKHSCSSNARREVRLSVNLQTYHVPEGSDAILWCYLFS